MVYLTYNDPVSGVYRTQVMDVVNYLNHELNAGVTLVALVSVRGYGHTRKQIRAVVPNAVVLPMVPKAKNWKLNYWILRFIRHTSRKRSIMARGVFATLLAQRLARHGQTKNVIFDGRGAYDAEWKEYHVSPDQQLASNMEHLERKAVNDSTFRLAVTHQLVKHWESKYGYAGSDHVIVPCTLQDAFMDQPGLDAAGRTARRAALGFDAADTLLVYAGSTAGWQSFGMLEKILSHHMAASKQLKCLFLSPPDEKLDALSAKFPGQVKVMFVAHKEVFNVLQSCDYGILIREQTVTNQVAAPTKFAEYLSAGLPVLISEGLGDYTEMVVNEKCGQLVTEQNFTDLQLPATGQADRDRMMALANKHFRKNAHRDSYRHLLRFA